MPNSWDIHDWVSREQAARRRSHDCTAVVDHKWSPNFITHETFRLEQFDLSPSLTSSLFAVKSHNAGRSGVNQVRFRNHLTHRK
jgi:hypothetical protein